MKKLITLALMLGVTSALAGSFTTPLSWTFGSANDGDGGFTTPTATGTEVWSVEADSFKYAFGVLATDESHTASLLKSIDLWRATDTGLKYTVTGVLDLTAGYGDDHNRMGVMLFNDADTQTADGGGLWLRLNTDDNQTVAIVDGVAGTVLTSVPHGQNPGDYWIGKTLTYTADFFFTDVNGTNSIDVTFAVTDGSLNFSVNAVVDAADYTGEYFGFASKWRQRGTASSARNVPAEFDYQSFSIIPEPATVGMFGAFGAALLFIRRRLARV